MTYKRCALDPLAGKDKLEVTGNTNVSITQLTQTLIKVKAMLGKHEARLDFRPNTKRIFVVKITCLIKY